MDLGTVSTTLWIYDMNETTKKKAKYNFILKCIKMNDEDFQITDKDVFFCLRGFPALVQQELVVVEFCRLR